MRYASSRSPVLSAVIAASATTVLVAVGADLLAGSHATHVALVGGVASAIGALRTHLAGRHRCLFGLLSALIVAQPTIHAVRVACGVSPGGATLTEPAHDGLLAFASLAFTAAILAAVGAAEVVLLAADAALQACWRSVLALVGGARVVPAGPLPVRSSEPDRPRGSAWVRREAGRGPPAAMSRA